MRVLVLSDTPFLPAAAGNRARIGAMLRYLASAGHELGLLLQPAVDRVEWDVPGMRAAVAWLEIADAPAPGLLARVAGRVARATAPRAGDPAPPIGIDDWCPSAFRARARARIDAWRPDVVLVEYVFLSACLTDLPDGGPDSGPVRVIDTHDVMHRRRAVYDAVGMAPQWFHTTADDERRGLLRADLVLAMQDDEAAALRALVPERTVLTVPHAMPVRPAPTDAARPARLLFVASYNDLNVRGLTWFLDAAWPALRARVPDVELVVCGNIAAKLGPLPPGVVARGFVERPDDEYAAARVVLSPLAGGTGLKVKAVDALCQGRPVVATTPGAYGLAHGLDEGVLVADEPAAFADAVHALLADPDRWARAVAGATAHAARRFAPDVAFAPLVAELERRRAGR
jgi:glycosyltransferase involved in cell wall biosynthesis